MHTKDTFPAHLFPSASPLLTTYLEINQLKLLYRQGWLQRGLPADQCESVADHVLSMAWLAWLMCAEHYPHLDAWRVVRLALVHEIGEIYVGDLTPEDNVPAAEKYRREQAAVWQVLGKWPHGPTYVALWEEFERADTPESQLARELDALELAGQAALYHRRGLEVSTFWPGLSARITSAPARALFEELHALGQQP